MIAIVDYEAGNLHSVKTALTRLGADYVLTSDPDVILKSKKVLLPGVGHAGEAISRIRDRGLDNVIRQLRKPVLGICVGMQVLCRHTDEGDADGLSIFDTDVVRFTPTVVDKVPHVGWNTINNLESKLFSGIKPGSYVYYVHSYYARLCIDTIATTRFGSSGDLLYSAALKYENFYGVQFHPEKSGDIGHKILENFLRL